MDEQVPHLPEDGRVRQAVFPGWRCTYVTGVVTRTDLHSLPRTGFTLPRRALTSCAVSGWIWYSLQQFRSHSGVFSPCDGNNFQEGFRCVPRSFLISLRVIEKSPGCAKCTGRKPGVWENTLFWIHPGDILVFSVFSIMGFLASKTPETTKRRTPPSPETCTTDRTWGWQCLSVSLLFGVYQLDYLCASTANELGGNCGCPSLPPPPSDRRLNNWSPEPGADRPACKDVSFSSGCVAESLSGKWLNSQKWAALKSHQGDCWS